MAQIVAMPPRHTQQFAKDQARADQPDTAQAPEIDEHDAGEVRVLEKIRRDHQHQRGQRGSLEDITDLAQMAADAPWSVHPHAFENDAPNGQDKDAEKE